MKAACFFILALSIPRAALGTAGDGDDPKKPNSPADGSDLSTTDRIDRLEKEIQELRAAENARRAGLPASLGLEPQAPGGPSPSGVEWGLSFTDGFHVRSSDGAFDLHIGGRVEEDYRMIFDRPTNNFNIAPGTFNSRVQPNTFYFHEVFVSVDGTVYRDWGFKVDGDFSPQGSNGNIPSPSGISGAIPEQAWVEWKHFDECRLQFGQFKAPNEAESIESPLFNELVNRSPMSRFVENWEVGLQLYGSVMESLFTYQIALLDGRGALANSGRDLVDDNDGKEVDARFTVAPFVGDKGSVLKGLRVGVWGSDAREGQGSPLASAAHPGNNPPGFPPAAGFASTDLFVGYLQFPAAGFVFHGARVREGAELTYTWGPFEFRGELMQRRDQFFLTAGPSAFDYGTLAMKGYYGQLTCIVTGEEKIPDTRISPLHPFDPVNGDWGAVELALRFGGISFDQSKLNQIFAAGAAPFAGNSNRMSSLATGFNWWFTKNTKLAFDYIAEHYYDNLQIGLEGRTHLNGFLAQAQIDF